MILLINIARKNLGEKVINLEIIEKVKKYIMIGNRKVHSSILDFFHQEFEFPWLYSRSMSKENVIYLWEKE